jgi:hypothetical protein
MSIYLAADSNSKNEGIGSATQYQLFLYGVCKKLNLKYAFLGFKDINMYQFHPEYDVTTWANKFTEYFNFPNELITDNYIIKHVADLNDVQNFIKNEDINTDTLLLLPPLLAGLLQLNSNEYREHFYTLSDNIKHDSVLDNTKYNISLHIRSLNKFDTDPNPIRELFDSNKNNYYTNIISNICKIQTEKEKIFHIHTQLNQETFNFLKQSQPDCTFIFYENTYPWVSLSCMIQSDILVGANSSLSYIAHLLNKNKSIFRNNFWHSLYSDCILADENGNFNI